MLRTALPLALSGALAASLAGSPARAAAAPGVVEGEGASRAGAARGAPESPPRVAYRGVGRCPAAYEAAFVVAARLPGATLAPIDAEAVDARIALEPSGDGYRGAIEDARGGVRVITGRRCAEVLDALAFAFAVARAEERRAAEPDPPADPQPSAPPLVAAATPDRDSLPVAPPGPALETHGALGLRAGAASGVGPALAPRGEIFFELGLDRGSPWLPAARVGAVYLAADGPRRAEGSAGFALWAATMELHLVRLGGRAGRTRLAPLLRAAVGDLGAESTGLTDARREHAVWASAGAGAVATWSLGPAFGLELAGGVDVALTRPRYFFEPAVTLHTVPAAGGWFAAGVALPIW